jgi:hypothetical protein
MNALTFEPVIQPVTYGDGRKAFVWRVLMRKRSRPVGITQEWVDGRRTECPTRRQARAAAKAEATRLRSRRLVVVRVMAKDIDDGKAHDPNTCAVAQSLWRQQEEWGLDRRNFDFEVDTYAAFRDPDGLVLHNHRDDTEVAIDPPPMVFPSKRSPGGWYEQSMEDYTRDFDDWRDAQAMTLAEWREHEGDDTVTKPTRPPSGSFVLDLDEIATIEAMLLDEGP